MNWMDWLLVAYFAANAFTIIAMVNRPRKPMEPLTAAIAATINAAFAVGIILTHGGA